MKLPPVSVETLELIKQGRWSCEETSTGWIIRTEPYSWCCNRAGQTIYHLDKTGAVILTHINVGRPSGAADREDR